MKNVLAGTLLMVAAILAMATSGPAGSEKKAEEEVQGKSADVTVSADALYQAYEANEVAADSRYKGSIVEVNGRIDSIGKDFMDTPYVALKTGHIIGTVQCMFAKGNTGELSNLKKGQTVTLKGKCEGKLGNVILRGCQIVR